MLLQNAAFHWLISGFTLLKALALGAKKYALKGENVKKCIRMGIPTLKIVISGGKLLVLWPQNAFNGYTDVVLPVAMATLI